MTLIDTNVLLDMFTNDPVWADWSIGQLDAAALKGPLVINDVVFAGLSVNFATIERLEAVLLASAVTMAAIPARRFSLQARCFSDTGRAVDGVMACFRISLSAPTPRLPG